MPDSNGLGVVVTVQESQRESFDMLAPGRVSWFTLISGELTPTDSMSAGVMELEPDGTGLRPHHHAIPEVYHVTAGSGVLTINGHETAIATGSTVFIPSNAVHSLRNSGEDTLRVFYVFSTDRFANVVYEYD